MNAFHRAHSHIPLLMLLEFFLCYVLTYIIKELLAVPLRTICVLLGGDKSQLREWPPVIREIVIVLLGLLYFPLFLLIALVFASVVYVVSFKEQLKNYAFGTTEYRQHCWKKLFEISS